MGRSSEGVAILEILGDKRNISQATLIVAAPKDSPKDMLKNAMYVVAFRKNMGIDTEEFVRAFDEVARTGEKQTLLIGDKEVHLINAQPLGFTISVNHR